MNELNLKQRVGKIIKLLKQEYPDSTCSLNFKTTHQLMVATILSAQCTDERVNIVTKDLFKKYKKPLDYGRAPLEELEKDIHSTGFFRHKAKSIKKSSQVIVERHKGRVPDNMQELVKLAGVGRKTATVILGTGFGKAEGVTVDTHVARISKRLGLTTEKTAEKIEIDLMNIIPKKDWIIFSHLLIDHGRAVCKARSPECERCMISKLCPFFYN